MICLMLCNMRYGYIVIVNPQLLFAIKPVGLRKNQKKSEPVIIDVN